MRRGLGLESVEDMKSSGPGIGNESVVVSPAKIKSSWGKGILRDIGDFNFEHCCVCSGDVLQAVGHVMVTCEGDIMTRHKFCTCQYSVMLKLARANEIVKKEGKSP